MAKIVVTAIEQELRKKLDIKPEPGEERGVFLERLLRKGQELTEAEWNAKKFSDAAEGWYNDAITAFSAASDPADIPEPPSKAQLAAAAEAEPEPEVEEAAEEEPEAEEEEPEEAEAEEVEAEAEEDAPEDPDETEVEETDEMVETATARKPRAAAKTAAPARRAPPPPAKKAVPAKKAAAAPVKKGAAAKVPARPVAKPVAKPAAKPVAAKKAAPAKKASANGRPKPVIGSTSFIKNLMIDNPQLSVGELRAECQRKGVLISDVTLEKGSCEFR
jgi:hypothetical protein